MAGEYQNQPAFGKRGFAPLRLGVFALKRQVKTVQLYPAATIDYHAPVLEIKE
jgi:hypothetical protein